MLVGMPDAVAEPPPSTAPGADATTGPDCSTGARSSTSCGGRSSATKAYPGGLALLAVAPDPLTCEHSNVTWEMREEICLLTAGRLVGCLHYSYPTTRVARDEFLVLAEGIGAAGRRRLSGRADSVRGP